MNTKDLWEEIDQSFQEVRMPSKEDMAFHRSNGYHIQGLLQDIERYRNQDVTIDLIRSLHQELSSLSPEAWRWILPHYLKYCLTSEAEYSQMETEFLIYALSPAPEFQPDTSGRLSKLNLAQLGCLVHFIEWCEENRFWKSYCPDDLKRAKEFLKKELGKKAHENNYQKPSH